MAVDPNNPYAQFGGGVETPATVTAVDPAAPVVAEVVDQSTPLVDIPAAYQEPLLDEADTKPKTFVDMSADEFKTALYDKMRQASAKGEAGYEDVANWLAEINAGNFSGIKENYAGLVKSPDAALGDVKLLPEGQNQAAGAAGGDAIGVSDIGAFFRGLGRTGTLNLGDEVIAAAEAVPAMFDPNQNAADVYARSHANQQVQSGLDDFIAPGAKQTGELAGIGLTALIPYSGIKSGAPMIGNMLRSGGIGAIEGAISGTGRGQPGGRFDNTLGDAALGAVVGTAAPLAVKAAAKVASPAIDFVTSRVGKNPGVSVISRRLGLTPSKMKDTADSLRMAGIEPTPFDLMGEVGQDFVGAMARRPGDGRGIMQQAADAKRLGFPDRVNIQAAKISPIEETPDELITGINARRNAAMESAMDPLRPLPVPVSDDLAAILQTGEGKQAIGKAMAKETDPAVKAEMMKLGRPMPVDPAVTQIKAMGLSPEQEASALAQIGAKDTSAVMTVDMADKIARGFNSRAEVAKRAGDLDTARVLQDYGRQVRGAARTAHTQYDEALTKYGDESAASNAVALGEDVLKPGTDQFVKKASALSKEKTTILPESRGNLQNIERQPTSDGGEFTVTDYVGPDGTTVRLGITTKDGVASVNVSGKDNGFSNGNWEEMANTMGPSAVRDMVKAVQKEFPEITEITGTRATGASAGGSAATKSMKMPPLPREYSERELAAAGARRAVERVAQEKVGGDAFNLAEKLAYADGPRARLESVVGPEVATDIGNSLAAEVTTARDLISRAPRSGSRTAINQADDDNLAAFGNVLANPSSPTAWAISGIKTLTRSGVSDKAAEDIVRLALDPRRVEEAIDLLTKQYAGNSRKAAFVIDTIRNIPIRNQE